MPNYLSFIERSKDAIPIAVVRGGKADGHFLYLNREEDDIDLPDDIEYHLEEHNFVETKYRNTKPICIRLPSDSEFEIIPNPKKRSCWYVYAKSGAGKSTVSSNIASNYKKMFRGRPMALISRKSDDPVLDKLHLKRLDAEELIDEPIEDIKEIAKSLIIADDVDTFKGQQEKAVFHLIDEVVSLGRSSEVSLIFATHKNSDGKKTSLIINEATDYVIFPKYATPQALNYLLNDKLGYNSKFISKLIEDTKGENEWVLLHCDVPNYMLSRHEARIIIK